MAEDVKRTADKHRKRRILIIVLVAVTLFSGLSWVLTEHADWIGSLFAPRSKKAGQSVMYSDELHSYVFYPTYYSLDPAANELHLRYLTGAQLAVASHARRLMDEDLAHPWTIGGLSEACGVSASTLKRYYAASYGQTPAKYLQTARIHKAAELLREDDAPIADCCAAVGYANASKFARVFREHMGLSPLAYRYQMRDMSGRGTVV